MRRNPAETAATHNKMTRRGLLLGGAQLGFMGLLGLRMRYLQVDQADEFRLLAEENRINIRLIPPARGEIFDRNGVVLAANEPSYRITIVREDAGDVEEVIARLSTLIELDDNALNRAMTEMKRSPPFLPVTVAERISWEEMSRVAVNTPALPGVTPEVGLSRQYTTNGDFAHVIGYVGPVSDYDLSKIEDPDQLLRIPRFQIGKVGLEAKREEDLRGKAGTKRVEVNAVGRVMRELDRREGQAGADLQLTVDQKLQSYVQARLGDESAAAVVMDCKTGDVLAINSAPTFDPNLFVRGISVADYSELTENDHRPLATKSVQGTYPPGSTFKMITALAALEEGVIDSEDTVWCPGHLEISNRRFHCWKRAGHGHMNLETALRESCDVFFYDVALKVGIDKITDMARRLGLGQKHDLPMSAVAGGLTPTKAWKERVRDAQWVPGDTANASIGQGFVLASPLQLAVMTARLASGLSLEPRLIKSINGQDQTPEVPAAELDINKNHLRQVRKAMFAVSNHRRGTAYSQRIIDDEYRLAGKTGTSQVRNITAAERRAGVIRNEDLPWERRDHGLFVNFAPYDDPKIAVAVVVEHGGGSKAATPIARDITLQALFDGDPPLEAYPSKDRSRIRAQQERMRRDFPQLSSKGNDRA